MTAYEACVRILRDGGCRCPLMWNGTICVPATICEQRPVGSAERRSCRVLASLPPVPELPASGPARDAHQTHVQCSDDSAT